MFLTTFWDISAFDAASWVGSESRYGDILERLDNIRRKSNNSMDALIGDTCLQEGYVLATNDQDLRKVIEALGGTTADLRRSSHP
jgi:predicted nucleic acid-binding protein